MRIERTKNAARNMLWGTISKVLAMVLPFVTRTLLLKLLGEQYLGLNGLFSSILQVLNMADLGFGVAIVYSMYKPIADDDQDAICALLAFYKKVYRVIGVVILVLGLALMPFLRRLISGDIPSNVNIYLLYTIYLANTVISYWLFAYKTSLLSAHQRNDITSKVSSALMILQYALQIGLLLVFDNYYIYLLVLPFVTVMSNLATMWTVKRLFPQYTCRGVVSKETKQELSKKVGALFLSKLCGTTRNSLDSVFISAFNGLRTVAIYGNYYYIFNAIHSLLGVANVSIVGGIGNSIAKESVEKNYLDYKKITFLYSWIAGWCACCLVCLYQPFMLLWVGKELLFPLETMILFSLYFFCMAMTDIKNTYTDACGLWTENRLRSILETVSNLILNCTLGYFFGVNGILLATLITIVAVNIAYGNQILFKHYFKGKSVFAIYARLMGYLIVTVTVSFVTWLLCSLLPLEGVFSLLIKMVICVIVPNALFFLAYFRTDDYQAVKPMVSSLIMSRFKR